MSKAKDRTYEVLFCDDEAEQRTKFCHNHAGSEFHITIEANIESLPRKLEAMGRLPDIVVLDLFHPILPADSPEIVRETAKIAQRVGEINALMEKLREEDVMFRPLAISVLKEIRSIPRLAKLPVLLYTRYGISTVNEEEMKEAIDLCADWMLKGRTAQTEQRMMYSIISAHERSTSIARDMHLGFLFAVVGAVIGAVISEVLRWLLKP
jgi:CheY-like chemotaxis protein